MRFIGKRSVESSKYLFFYEDADKDLSTAQTEQEFYDLLSEAATTPRTAVGTRINTTKVHAKDSGAFLNVGIAADAELAGGAMKALLPSYPLREDYRNGRPYGTNTLQTSLTSPYYSKPSAVKTFAGCGQNSLFLIKPTLRGSYAPTTPATARSYVEGGSISVFVAQRTFGLTNIEKTVLSQARSFGCSGWGQHRTCDSGFVGGAPSLSVGTSDFLLALSNAGYGTQGGNTRTTYTEETLPKVGKSGVVSTLPVAGLAQAVLPFFNSNKKQVEYIELTEGTDYTCLPNLEENKPTIITMLPSPVNRLLN